MASAAQVQTLLRFRDAAKAAGHIWPEYAACEAALESRWGASELARLGRNLFGQKQRTPPTPPLFETVELPTEEIVSGAAVREMARWVVFPTIAECFRERMFTLRTLRIFYSDYARALAATTGEEYVIAVSRKWSTDPQRAEKVLEIYRAHSNALSFAASASA